MAERSSTSTRSSSTPAKKRGGATHNARYFAYFEQLFAGVSNAVAKFDDDGKLAIGGMKLSLNEETLDIKILSSVALDCYHTALASSTGNIRTVNRLLREKTDDPFFLGFNHAVLDDYVTHQSRLPAGVLKRGLELQTQKKAQELKQFVEEMVQSLFPTRDRSLLPSSRREMSQYDTERLIGTARRLSQAWGFDGEELVQGYQQIAATFNGRSSEEPSEMEANREASSSHEDSSSDSFAFGPEVFPSSESEALELCSDDGPAENEEFAFEDLDSLGTGKPLTDRIISHAFQRLKLRRSVQVANIAATAAFLDGGRFPAGISFEDAEQVHFIVNRGFHWILVIFLPAHRLLLVLDSAPAPFPDSYPELAPLKGFLEGSGFPVDVYCPKVPRQAYDFDCGIFVILFAEFFASNYTGSDNIAKVVSSLHRMDLESRARTRRLWLWLELVPLPVQEMERQLYGVHDPEEPRGKLQRTAQFDPGHPVSELLSPFTPSVFDMSMFRE